MYLILRTHVERYYYFHFAMSQMRELQVTQPVSGGMGVGTRP